MIVHEFEFHDGNCFLDFKSSLARENRAGRKHFYFLHIFQRIRSWRNLENAGAESILFFHKGHAFPHSVVTSRHWSSSGDLIVIIRDSILSKCLSDQDSEDDTDQNILKVCTINL